MFDISALMAGLTFYCQKRMDGGMRTGVMLGATTVLEKYEEGPDEEYGPVLIWSVDLRCNGPGLPTTAEDARQWLLNHEAIIRDGFLSYADELQAGSDPTGPYLLQWSKFPAMPEGVALEIVCGALRRVDARYLASTLKEIGNHWNMFILSLAPYEPAMS